MDYEIASAPSDTISSPLVMPFTFARRRSALGIIALAFLMWAMTGCGGPPAIVGKWRPVGQATSTTVWEFARDRSFLMGQVRGKYSFGDRDRVKIQTPFATSIYQMEFSGDRMTLKDARGSKLEFTRVE